MSNNETQKEEDKEIMDVVNHFIEEVREKELVGEKKEFKERLKLFRTVVLDYVTDPLSFTIMGDAYLTFFNLKPEEEEFWLKSGMEDKFKFIKGLRDLAEPEVMIRRALSFNGVLKFSAGYYRSPVHLMASDRLMYTLSGIPSFLTDLGFAPYKTIPQNQEIENPFPDDGHEGMFM